MTTPDEAMLTEWECDIRDALADIDGKRWICANDALNALIEHVRAGQSANAERVSLLEAENARLREALETIAEGRDAGRHDGLPEDYPVHEADLMFAVARAALGEAS
jgi:hypothetical protein